MSSILKALEKVEESQNPRRHGSAAGLARSRERRPAWLIPAWSLGGAAAATLVTYALMGGFSKPAKPVAAAPAASVATSAPVASPMATPAPVAVATPAPVAKKATKQATSAKTVAKPVAKAAAKTVVRPVAKTAIKQVARTAAKPAGKLPRLPAIPVAGPTPVASASMPAAPALAAAPPEPLAEKSSEEVRLTGIAWQNNSESSFAMVNGRAVRQGGVVDGFKVERIYEDSVRLSGSNGTITIPLGAGE